jgi:hypothetical protein
LQYKLKALSAFCKPFADSEINRLCISVDLQLKFFDIIVLPILAYSCEVWGFENCAEIEKVHLQFCKKMVPVELHILKI